MNPRKDVSPLISAYGISVRLNRSHNAILDAIKRLGIEPQIVTTAGSYYSEKSVEKVAAGMRKPNRKTASKV